MSKESFIFYWLVCYTHGVIVLLYRCYICRDLNPGAHFSDNNLYTMHIEDKKYNILYLLFVFLCPSPFLTYFYLSLFVVLNCCSIFIFAYGYYFIIFIVGSLYLFWYLFYWFLISLFFILYCFIALLFNPFFLVLSYVLSLFMVFNAVLYPFLFITFY